MISEKSQEYGNESYDDDQYDSRTYESHKLYAHYEENEREENDYDHAFNRNTRKKHDNIDELFTKRLSSLSIDSAYESIKLPTYSAAEVVFHYLLGSIDKQPTVHFMNSAISHFMPLKKVDLDGLLSTLDLNITPASLDSTIFASLHGHTFSTLDQEISQAFVSYLTPFLLEDLDGYLNAGKRALKRDACTLAFMYFSQGLQMITRRDLKSRDLLAYLGKCYLIGIGTWRNVKLALDCFMEASGDDDVLLFLEFVKYAGPENNDLVIGWLRRLAIHNCQAQFLLAQCYFQGMFGVQVDMGMAREWLVRARSNGLFKGEMNTNQIKWGILED